MGRTNEGEKRRNVTGSNGERMKKVNDFEVKSA